MLRYRKLLIWLSSLALVFAIGIYTVKWYVQKNYKDIILNFVLDEVSARLTTRVDVGDFDFEVFAKFPYASIVLEELYADGARYGSTRPDTLMYFQKIYLHLNLLDIYRGNYQIKKVALENGYLHLRVDEKGQANYMIFKEQPGKSAEDDAFIVALNEVEIQELELTLSDKQNHVWLKSRQEEGVLSGAFFSSSINIEADLVSHLQELSINEIPYVNQVKSHFSGEVAVTDNYQSFSLSKGSITIDDQLNFTAAGQVTKNNIDLVFNGNRLTIVDFLRLVPESYRNQMDMIKGKGTLAFQSTLKGPISSTQTPDFNARFTVENGELYNKGNGYTIEKLYLKGYFSNASEPYEHGLIELDTLAGVFNDQQFSGQLGVYNLIIPTVKFQLNGYFDLRALQVIHQMEAFKIESGALSGAFGGEINFNNIQNVKPDDLLSARLKGEIDLSNLKLRDNTGQLLFGADSAAITLNDKGVAIQDLTGTFQQTDFTFSGSMPNLLTYLFAPDQLLKTTGLLQIAHLNLSSNSNNKGAEQATVAPAFPDFLDLKCQVEINKLTYNKFEAQQLKGLLWVNGQNVMLKQFDASAFDGKLNGLAFLVPAKNQEFSAHIEAKAQKINIKKLFAQTANLGQDYLRAEHIEGTASGDLFFNCKLDSTLVPIAASMVATNTLKIDNGRLTNFEQMQSVADYFDSNAILRKLFKAELMKEKLKDIQFANLANEIRLQNSTVIIPEMRIKSNFMDLTLYGEHSFSNRIYYELDFKLSELMSKSTEPIETEFGEIQQNADGGRTVYLTIEGTVDDFQINLNKNANKAAKQRKLQEEKLLVKQLLNEEFGGGSKPTSSAPKSFDLEFEEFETAPKEKTVSTSPNSDTTAVKTESGFKKLIKKVAGTPEQQQAPEIEFDEDL